MRLITDNITLAELKEMARKGFGVMVKAVVDIEKEIMAVNGELHADEERLLLEKGSGQNNLWGINIYPDEPGDDFIEYDSMINVRPHYGNKSRGIDDKNIRDKVKKIVFKLVKK